MKGGVPMSIQNHKGSVLVVVMVVMITLTILGVALGSIALNDQRQTVRQQKNNEAFYLARSGAETVATMLLENQENITDYIGETTSVELGNGSFEVKVTSGGSGVILIESIGHSGSYSDKVTLSLVNDGSGGAPWMPILDMALFTEGNISLTGSAKVAGNVGTNSSVPSSVYIAGGGSVDGGFLVGVDGDPEDVIIGVSQWDGGLSSISGPVGNIVEDRYYPMPEFPEFPNDLPHKGNFTTPWVQGLYYPIDEEGEYSSISITSNRTVTIDVPEGEVRRIKVDTLSLSGHIDIPGEGRVELYVDEFIWGGGVTINNGGDPTKLIIYYRGASDPMLINNIKIWGFVYVDTANLTMGSNAAITGGVIVGGDLVTVEGDGEALVTAFYAPNAIFDATNSGHIKGAVVCKTFSSSGGGAGVTYNPEVQEIWDAMPELDFNFGENPDSGSGSGSGFRRGYWGN